MRLGLLLQLKVSLLNFLITNLHLDLHGLQDLLHVLFTLIVDLLVFLWVAGGRREQRHILPRLRIVVNIGQFVLPFLLLGGERVVRRIVSNRPVQLLKLPDDLALLDKLDFLVAVTELDGLLLLLLLFLELAQLGEFGVLDFLW